MRILHTSDWHIGRTFHGYPTLDAAREVLATIPTIVREHGIDVVLVAGDVYDLANPSADAVAVLREGLEAILAAGAAVVVVSGNHDSATRLGFAGAFSAAAGLHILTDPESVGRPVELHDEHGPVDVYALPYLQPDLIRQVPWVPAGATTQRAVVSAAMDQVRASVEERRSPGRRSIVLSHTFVAGGETSTTDSERAITREPRVAGGIDVVPVDAFAGVDYAALGHIHGRAILAEQVRYSGALLHYSFSEAGKPRGGWLVTLGDSGLIATDWADFPLHRPLRQLTGSFADLLADPALDPFAEHYIRAVYTDATRQAEPMRKLKARFPWCAEVVWEPAERVESHTSSYAERVAGKSDQEVAETFLADVRAGEGPTTAEAQLLAAVISAHEAAGVR